MSSATRRLSSTAVCSWSRYASRSCSCLVSTDCNCSWMIFPCAWSACLSVQRVPAAQSVKTGMTDNPRLSRREKAGCCMRRYINRAPPESNPTAGQSKDCVGRGSQVKIHSQYSAPSPIQHRSSMVADLRPNIRAGVSAIVAFVVWQIRWLQPRR